MVLSLFIEQRRFYILVHSEISMMLKFLNFQEIYATSILFGSPRNSNYTCPLNFSLYSDNCLTSFETEQ